jgi:hypothetical protein
MGIHTDAFEAKTKERRDFARKMRIAGFFILLVTVILALICHALNIPVDVALTPWISIPITFGAIGGVVAVALGAVESY